MWSGADAKAKGAKAIEAFNTALSFKGQVSRILQIRADINSRLEISVTTGPIRGSSKVHVGPLGVAMREIDEVCARLAPRQGEPDAWREEWCALGARLEKLADAAEAAGRARSGKGCYVDFSMLDGQVSLLTLAADYGVPWGEAWAHFHWPKDLQEPVARDG